MYHSPIVVQRKSTAPLEGSSNPFDDYDVFDLGTSAIDPRQPSRASVKLDRTESDDFFDLFSDSGSAPNSPALPGGRSPITAKPSGLRVEVKAKNLEGDEDDDDTASEASSSPPPIPPRITIPQDWAQRIRELVIPFDADDKTLYQFLVSSIEVGSSSRMTIIIDPTKTIRLIQDSTLRTVLTTTKRMDGLKALALSSNFPIMMLPTDRAIAQFGNQSPSSPAGSMLEPVRIAKLRSNAIASQYSLFDQGKSPTKAAGVMEMRRELMSVKFEVANGIYTRRATWCCLPAPNHTKRPSTKDETLYERFKKLDPTVVSFSPYKPPQNKRLPRLEDLQGFALIHSVKNMILYDLKTQQAVYRLGRVDDKTFRIEFNHPFSILTAFALAVASIDTKVSPNHQL